MEIIVIAVISGDLNAEMTRQPVRGHTAGMGLALAAGIHEIKPH